MFEFEDRSKWRHPDPEIPGASTGIPLQTYKENPRKNISYWLNGYYLILWGLEIQQDPIIQKRLKKLKKSYVKYFKSIGYTTYNIWIEQQIQSKRLLVEPSENLYSSVKPFSYWTAEYHKLIKLLKFEEK